MSELQKLKDELQDLRSRKEILDEFISSSSELQSQLKTV